MKEKEALLMKEKEGLVEEGKGSGRGTEQEREGSGGGNISGKGCLSGCVRGKGYKRHTKREIMNLKRNRMLKMQLHKGTKLSILKDRKPFRP